MKHIKEFKKFEAIIVPNRIENTNRPEEGRPMFPGFMGHQGSAFSSFEEFVEYGQENEFDVVDYNEFYNSLSESDKKTAPKMDNRLPFFALFHPQRKRPMFVLCDKHFIRNPFLTEIVNDVIGHERVHAEQFRKMGDIEYNLPDPMKRKEYFSDKMEVMAFSWSIANEISRSKNSIKDAIKLLNGNRLWQDIKRVCDESTLKRYKKYIYLYLEDMFSPNS